MKKIIVANWKMNGSFEAFAHYLQSLQQNYSPSNLELIIAPPFVYLDFVKKNIQLESIKLAGQSMVCYNDGARTGDINARMLRDIGSDFVIIGHSECRINHGFDNVIAGKTVASALQNGLKVILCVGEEKSDALANEVIIEQVVSGLEGIDKAESSNIIIAYEPVWAIGTGIVPSPLKVLEKRDIIYATLYSLGFNETRIIYGGSVTQENAKDFVKNASIDGLIIGKASMDADGLKSIIHSLNI